MSINYRKTDDALKKAWFAFKNEFKKANPSVKTLSVVSFVAGWNACQDKKKEGE